MIPIGRLAQICAKNANEGGSLKNERKMQIVKLLRSAFGQDLSGRRGRKRVVKKNVPLIEAAPTDGSLEQETLD